jgi:hypothetical protein
VFFPEDWAEWNQEKIREAGGPGAATAAGGESGEGDCMDPGEIVEPAASP